jgi:peptidylprolyl isomerase
MRSTLRRPAGLLALLLAATLGCGDDDDPVTPAPTATTIEATTFAPSLGVNLAASTKTANGLYYRDLVVGTGATVSAGQRATMRYIGTLANGTQFDPPSGTTPSTFTFTVGTGEVIAGWDQGIPGMRVGGRRQLIIPASLGYGASGRGPIPPNAVLVFTVELAAVQ